MINAHHQKTFIILKSNVMSNSNVKMLQYNQYMWKGNYKYSMAQGIFTKWRRLMTICCL